MLTNEQFAILKQREGNRVRLFFDDGEQVVATLVDVTTDLEGSRHLLYDRVEWSSGAEALQANHCFYVAGESIARFEDA